MGTSQIIVILKLTAMFAVAARYPLFAAGLHDMHRGRTSAKSAFHISGKWLQFPGNKPVSEGNTLRQIAVMRDDEQSKFQFTLQLPDQIGQPV